MKTYRSVVTIVMLVLGSAAHAAADVALITALDGKVARTTVAGAQDLEAFVKLKAGDVLNTVKGASVQIVYFENGRQESWSGVGKLEITPTEGRATGLPAPQVKQLPLVIVKQMARTPTLDSQGRAGVTRLRAIATPEAITTLDETYKKMRAEAPREDLNPELYLLAGMFELKQLDRVEKTLNELKQAQPANNQVKMLASLYGKALRDARAAATAPQQ